MWEPKAESFGQMVEWWTDALTRGAWKWDRKTLRWERDLERRAELYRINPLV